VTSSDQGSHAGANEQLLGDSSRISGRGEAVPVEGDATSSFAPMWELVSAVAVSVLTSLWRCADMAARNPGGQARIVLTPIERRQYVQWWLTKAGLSRAELVAIATGLAFFGDAASRARSEDERRSERHP
jgi:hypothetical protein